MRQNISKLLNDPRFDLPALILLGTICLIAIVIFCRSPTKHYKETYVPVAVPQTSDIALTGPPALQQTWMI